MAADPDSFIGRGNHHNAASWAFDNKREWDPQNDIEDEAVQQRIMRRGRMVYCVIMVVVLLVLTPSFFGIGMLLGSMNGEICGSIGQYQAPACTEVAWEFVVGASAMGFVLVYLIVPGLPMIFCIFPRKAKKRRRLRLAELGAGSGDSAASVRASNGNVAPVP